MRAFGVSIKTEELLILGGLGILGWYELRKIEGMFPQGGAIVGKAVGETVVNQATTDVTAVAKDLYSKLTSQGVNVPALDLFQNPADALAVYQGQISANIAAGLWQSGKSVPILGAVEAIVENIPKVTTVSAAPVAPAVVYPATQQGYNDIMSNLSGISQTQAYYNTFGGAPVSGEWSAATPYYNPVTRSYQSTPI